MSDNRETILPLALGVLFALAVHLGAAASYIAVRDTAPPDRRHSDTDTKKSEPKREEPRNEPKHTPPEPPKNEPPIGQDEPSDLTLNWISAEGFQELLARKAGFDQAAVQKTTDPIDDAPIPLDPTPPLPQPSIGQSGAPKAEP